MTAPPPKSPDGECLLTVSGYPARLGKLRNTVQTSQDPNTRGLQPQTPPVPHKNSCSLVSKTNSQAAGCVCGIVGNPFSGDPFVFGDVSRNPVGTSETPSCAPFLASWQAAAVFSVNGSYQCCSACKSGFRLLQPFQQRIDRILPSILHCPCPAELSGPAFA